MDVCPTRPLFAKLRKYKPFLMKNRRSGRPKQRCGTDVCNGNTSFCQASLFMTQRNSRYRYAPRPVLTIEQDEQSGIPVEMFDLSKNNGFRHSSRPSFEFLWRPTRLGTRAALETSLLLDTRVFGHIQWASHHTHTIDMTAGTITTYSMSEAMQAIILIAPSKSNRGLDLYFTIFGIHENNIHSNDN